MSSKKYEKMLVISKRLGYLRREITQEVKSCKIKLLDDLVSWCAEKEEDRLVLCFFSNSTRLTYYPSEKTMEIGLVNFLKKQTYIKVYNKPYKYVAYPKVN